MSKLHEIPGWLRQETVSEFSVTSAGKCGTSHAKTAIGWEILVIVQVSLPNLI